MIHQQDELVLNTSIKQLTSEVLERLGVLHPTQQQITLVHALFDYITTDREIHFNSRLSAREQTCLYLLAQGKNLEEIATDMQIKRTTVVTFMKRIKNKLGCHTLPQAVFLGMGSLAH